MTAAKRIAVLLGLTDDEEVWDDTNDGPPVAHEQPDGSPGEGQMAPPSIGRASAAANAGRSVTIRPVAPKPLTIAPQKKDDLRKAIDALRTGHSVIVDVTRVPSDLRYRMLDYLSGGCSAMSSRMEKVAVGVFLLEPTPAPPS